jgi:hypothetical protein
VGVICGIGYRRPAHRVVCGIFSNNQGSTSESCGLFESEMMLPVISVYFEL